MILALVSLRRLCLQYPRLPIAPRFAFLCAWFSGFLVWANLHYVHDYYIYAGAVFFICWAVISLWGVAGRLPLMLSLLANGHRPDRLYDRSVRPLLSPISTTSRRSTTVGNGKAGTLPGTSRHLFPEDQVLIIFGDDWSPFIPYYAEALCQTWCAGPTSGPAKLMRTPWR